MSDSKKANEPLFKINPGVYCGLFVRKRLAKRLHELLEKQQQEIREMLASNLKDTEVQEWTLAYPDGEQTSVEFFDPNASQADKMRRVELFTKLDLLKKEDEVFKAASMDEAERVYLEHHGKLKDLKKSG